MKRYNTHYFLLFVLLIMGAFSSMAQNDYGNIILGGVAFSFSIFFAVQFGLEAGAKAKREVNNLLELAALTTLTAILGMRVFYIRFPFVEFVFGISGVVLIAVYILRSFAAWQSMASKNKMLATLLMVFYASIVLYLLSMTLVPFMPYLSQPAGTAAFAFLIASVVGGLLIGPVMLTGEKITFFSTVARNRDRSVVLISLFVLFTAYAGLTRVHFLPSLYSDEFPRSYFEMVNDAELRNEKPVEGLYRYEGFKKAYDQFLKDNPTESNASR